MAVVAELGAAGARLRITGDCRMADAPEMELLLARLREARPATLVVSLAAPVEFDIGPAWLLHQALADLRASGARIELDGPVPEHFPYLDGLLARQEPAAPVRGR